MRSLIDKLVYPGLNRQQQLIASAAGIFIGILISLALLLGSAAMIDALLD